MNFDPTPGFVNYDIHHCRFNRPGCFGDGVSEQQLLLNWGEGVERPAKVPLAFFRSWNIRIWVGVPS